ncbi:unnamed protein product (macronuclear) [Paramecium tetraurelia]|uniref:C3H1-type domain-containing protein n=1 Tax=Paramecium tetraurelia TaxID=5888 RepID=A0C9Q5_PARTE|nr:uncharacterized protein GSPATT00006828001 [Paramecium tetraurelia]CAK67522.1 unnamed protein product [Paramecium tetraurelia]|eukprot:XP_001434919.1 hypothetical protein (macronuclear) [Paramecium tetraurelia strain d4-2]
MQANQVQFPNQKYKTQLCRHFITNGNCALGARCQFAHGRQELRANANGFQPNSEFIMHQNPQVAPPLKVQPINPMIANYKTQLCKHFNPQTGQCKNGATCTFAHGEQELNQMNPYFQNQYMLMQQQIKQQNQAQIQAELTQQILIMILSNMEHIFPGQQDIINVLKQGQEKAKQGDNQGASEIIKLIIHDEQRTKEEKQQYQQIYNNAQRHYDSKLKEYLNQ